MANTIQIKRSGTSSSVPETSGLVSGELAINYADGKLFTLKDDGSSSSVITIGEDLDSENFADRIRAIIGITDTFEPIGFPNRTSSSVSFDNTTRTFTIAPTGDSFDVWCKGKKYTVTEAQSVQIGSTTGLYYIYYSNAGLLSYRVSYFDWENDTPTSYVYWNATTGTATYFADERHGVALDWATHEYLHRTRGAVLANGFSASNYVLDGDGSLDSHAQIDIGGGTFFDEDLEVLISHNDTPTPNTWQQDLQGPAKIPVFYISGTEWFKDTATNFPLKQGATFPVFNSFDGSSWSIVEGGSNKYIVNFIIATNNLNEPVISVLGQGDYSNLGDAEAIQFSDLALDGFPSVEFRPLYKIVFQIGNYVNAPNARIRSVIDIRQVSSASVGQAIGSDHGILSGLGDDDHLQYLHASNSRAGVSADIETSGTLSTTNSTESNSSTTGALKVAGGAGIGGNLNVQGSVTTNGTTLSLGVASKGSILAVNTDNTITALHGTESSNALLLYNSDNDLISWVTEIDGGSFAGTQP